MGRSLSKVICEASTYETSPLGSAEWIKFFGYLFGKEAEAEAAYRDGLRAPRDELGDANPYVSSLLSNYARLLCKQERFADAEPLYTVAFNGCRAAQGDADPYVVQLLEAQAECLVRLERRADAHAALAGFLESTPLERTHENYRKVQAIMRGLDAGDWPEGGKD